MKIRNLLITLTAIVVCVSFIKPSAWAGNVQRNRWEGVAIGVGAAIIGTALIHSLQNSKPAYQAPVYYSPRHRKKPSGYWQIRKVWVPPTYERVWNPAHYTRSGTWVPGQWIRIEKAPGYWAKEKVWVCRE